MNVTASRPAPMPTASERFTTAISYMKSAVTTFDEVASAEPGDGYGEWAQETLYQAEMDLREARNQMVIGVDLLERAKPKSWDVVNAVNYSIDTLDELRGLLGEMDLSIDLSAQIARPMADARRAAELLRA